jgi:hypothetical protein
LIGSLRSGVYSGVARIMVLNFWFLGRVFDRVRS